MSRKDDLIKSKSIYTLRTKHMTVPNGTIYENDHVTIIMNDGIFDDEVAMFSDSNFKFKIGGADRGKRKHTRKWFTELDNGSGNVWTLGNLPEVKKATDGEINLKVDYKSIKDFAYYGSAVELIKATVNDIIMRYPGGLYYYPIGIAPKLTISGETYYAISNEFNIDFWSPKGCSVDYVENPLRVLGASYTNYEMPNGFQATFDNNIWSDCLESIIGEVRLNGKTFKIYLNGNGDKYILTTESDQLAHKYGNTIIKPKKEFFDKFWSSIDDFEKVLLNRSSKPLYKAVLEKPYVMNGKHYYEYKSFIWPKIIDDVPDVSSGVFGGYLNSLLEIAEYYDEYDSDNIWRMLTHESIKNLDYTFRRLNGSDEIDMSDIDFSRMKAMLRVHGRVYDDIKRYADGIKYINSVTYDGINNLPDYFLSDVVELAGFEAKSINKLQKTDNGVDISSEDCFTGVSSMTVNAINGEFMRRFALSKDFINSEKGTRRGIESVMGMFGYRHVDESIPFSSTDFNFLTGDYQIHENIRVAHYFPRYMEMARLRSYTNEYLYGDNETNFMQGYPVAVVSPAIENPTEQDYYLIPWVNNYMFYQNDIYFQEKGGWGKIKRKKINLNISSATTIYDTYANFCLDLWNETSPYMMFVNDIDELTSLSNNIVYEGMVCYVTDITKVYTTYSAKSDYDNTTIVPEQQEHQGQDEQHANDRGSSSSSQPVNTSYNPNIRDYSHYFILYNPALSTHIGYVNNDLYSCYGWKNIFNSEFNGVNPTTIDGLKVLYLESLNLDVNGNNPHCGYGKYDNGDSYIDKLNRLFGTQVDNGVFEYMKREYSEDYDAICTSGFSISGLVEDNKKCYYFYDNEDNGNETEIVFKSSSEEEEEDGGSAGRRDFLDGDTSSGPYSHFINSENTSSQVRNTEAAAFSIVNVKNLTIEIKTDGNEYFEDYLRDVVFKYLNEMIPSTTILEYKFIGTENSSTPSVADIITPDANVIDETIVADGVIIDGDSTYFIEK